MTNESIDGMRSGLGARARDFDSYSRAAGFAAVSAPVHRTARRELADPLPARRALGDTSLARRALGDTLPARRALGDTWPARLASAGSHVAGCLLAGCLLAAGLLAGCGNGDDAAEPRVGAGITGIRYLAAPAADGFDRATGPRRFRFPQDHGAHPTYRTEWWYFTGNLFDADRRHFGFELTFFRVGLQPDRAAPAPGSGADSEAPWATNAVWMAHFALTNTQSRRFLAAERLSRGHPRLAYTRTGPWRLRVEDWHAEQTGPASLQLAAAEPSVAIELRLEGLDRIVLQGDSGYDRKGPEPGNASYYYSAPRLIAAGTVHDAAGEAHSVTGTAWLDREWSTSALSPGIEGWDWFALQLNDGRDLMYYRLRGVDGSTSPYSAGSIVDPSGASHRLDPGAVELVATDHWRSAQSGVSYPVAWRLSIPTEELELEVTPYLPNQEIDLSVRYWEGAVAVTGKSADSPVAGHGYLELAGYQSQ